MDVDEAKDGRGHEARLRGEERKVGEKEEEAGREDRRKTEENRMGPNTRSPFERKTPVARGDGV
jgi:hypothetical protein